MDLDPNSPIPLYHQLKTDLLDRIRAGEFLPGERIPTEHELCRAYRVSRTTARQAMTDLADEDVILRAPRRGSIVAPGWRATAEDTKMRMVLSDSARADRIADSIHGSVTVDMAATADGARIEVTDTGIGIDLAELPHIFERFYRGSRSNEARGSGSGLGLAIVRSIVEMHGGRVAVESRVGGGSRFTVTLPRDPRLVAGTPAAEREDVAVVKQTG